MKKSILMIIILFVYISCQKKKEIPDLQGDWYYNGSPKEVPFSKNEILQSGNVGFYFKRDRSGYKGSQDYSFFVNPSESGKMWVEYSYPDVAFFFGSNMDDTNKIYNPFSSTKIFYSGKMSEDGDSIKGTLELYSLIVHWLVERFKFEYDTTITNCVLIRDKKNNFWKNIGKLQHSKPVEYRLKDEQTIRYRKNGTIETFYNGKK